MFFCFRSFECVFYRVHFCDLGHLVQHFVVDICDFFFDQITQFVNHNLAHALFCLVSEQSFTVVHELVVDVLRR